MWFLRNIRSRSWQILRNWAVQKGTRGLRQTAWNASIQFLRNFKLKGNKYSIKNYFLLFEKKTWFRPNDYYSKWLR